MSLAIVHCRAQVDVEAMGVTVEAHLANGLPSLSLVGLPETAVKECGRFDLAISLNILATNGRLPAASFEPLECLGELALSVAFR